jgi:hypothetical protein
VLSRKENAFSLDFHRFLYFRPAKCRKDLITATLERIFTALLRMEKGRDGFPCREKTKLSFFEQTLIFSGQAERFHQMSSTQGGNSGLCTPGILGIL